MRKEKCAITASAIAAIFTISVLVFALQYQAFALCPPGVVGCTGGQGGVGQILAGHEVNQRLTDAVTQANVKILGHEKQLGQTLVKGFPIDVVDTGKPKPVR